MMKKKQPNKSSMDASVKGSETAALFLRPFRSTVLDDKKELYCQVMNR
jgi:hypothetical protein